MRLLLIPAMVVLSLDLVNSAQANFSTISAYADMTTTPGPFTYGANQYDITLHNTGGTAISTFWYAWDDSQLNFLPDSTNLYYANAPSGWSAIPTYGYAYDQNTSSYTYTYGLEWYTSSSPLAPGDSLSGFGFQSDDTPEFLAGLSSYTLNPGDPLFPVGTSFVYENYPPNVGTDPSYQFVVAPSVVPEPGSITLLMGAAVAPLFSLRRKK